jgi:hypothetical protein
MSSVAEIYNALSGLNNDELRQVERALISIYRQRRTGIIYDDAYGVLTEQDLAVICQDSLDVIQGER